ncbi:MAG: trypsin-like peptidase domain-containing protein [bacterium]|nr:trypsin-like peptidase domain-containing protein [bacterium]
MMVWAWVVLSCTSQPMVETNAQPAQADYLSFKTEDEANNIEIFKKASPAVVYVSSTTLQRDVFSLNVFEIPQGTGTGFIWNKDGIIVTNHHVIENANRVTITLNDNTTWDAEVIGRAPFKDLAVLRIEAPKEKLVPLPLGDSSLLEVGRKVLAIGNPFGLDFTLTVGVVSALGREIETAVGQTKRKIRDVIQTDAAINPGNSGGPLLNALGQIIGVNTAIQSPSGASAGIGFAIPVNTVKKIVPQLIKYGKVERPIMGVNILPDYLARRNKIGGAVVAGVDPGSPADRAGMVGIRRIYRRGYVLGDIILEINEQAVKSFDDVATILEKYKPGNTVTVITERDGKRQRYRIRLISSRDY